jgi:MYXO-CTERM domain-containing protein
MFVSHRDLLVTAEAREKFREFRCKLGLAPVHYLLSAGGNDALPEEETSLGKRELLGLEEKRVMDVYRKSRAGIAAFAAALIAGAIGSPGYGGIIDNPMLQIQLQINGADAGSWELPGIENPDGTYSYSGYYWDTEGEQEWSFSSEVTADDEPFINWGLGFTNSSVVTNTYTLTVTMPSMPIPGASLMGGSFSGSVTDANNDGSATVAAVAGSQFYTGLIDGAPPPGAQLYPFPASFSAPFAGGSANIPAASFGLPGPFFPGPPVATNIGIRVEFSLTPGDQVAFTSFFDVEPVPGPGALALLGFAALAARSRRRR